MRRLPTRLVFHGRHELTTGARARPLRRPVALALVVLGALLGLLGPAGGAAAQDPGTTVPSGPTGTQVVDPGRAAGRVAGPDDVVVVASLTGLIDPVVAEFLRNTIDELEQSRATVALILNLDLEGSVIPDAELVDLVRRLQQASFPVNIWVGPTGSQLSGRASLLLAAADQVAMAPGTTIGGVVAGDSMVVVDPIGGTPEQQRRLELVRAGRYDVKQAKDAGLTTLDAPVIGDFIVNLPGVQTNEKTKDGVTRREPVTPVVFTQLSLLDSFFHSAASPAVAYLLFTIGMALLIFELFTAGVGVAGVIGAGSFVFACYGLVVLPNHWYGIALLVASMVAFAIDVQTGVPRVWTGIGIGLYVLGSLTLYSGEAVISWLTVAIGIMAAVLAFMAGMPSMVRTRFSTPTIGREWMVGEMGRAVTDISPNGVVEIRGAQWRATTNRATPIEQLDRVRVTGIEGLVLEVEPEEGGARDYRDRSPRA